MPTTIAALAAELGVDHRRVRQWLRRNRPRPTADKWAPYDLSDADADAVRAAYAARAAAISVPPEARDWFWEGNVQRRLAEYLEASGWKIERTADTASGEHGEDIRARKGDDVLRVEVKGWPSKAYANPARANETKRTKPSTQAGHWYSEALLRAIRDLGRHPDDLVALGFPEWARFRRLLDDTREPIARLGLGVFFVAEDGTVQQAMQPTRPHRQPA